MDVVRFPAAGVTTITTMTSGFYANSLKRCWVIVPQATQYITIDLEKISTEPKYDLVEVRSITWYDETDSSVEGADPASPLTSFSGEWTLEALAGTGGRNFVRGELGQALMITLSTDSNFNSYYGFQAKVSAWWRDCHTGMQLLQPQGTAALQISDGYSEYAPGMALCMVIVPPTLQSYVQLSFAVFATEAEFDVLDIAPITGYNIAQKQYHGRSTTPIAQLSGILSTPLVVRGGLGQTLLLRFRSDFSIQASGFAASVSVGVPATGSPTKAPTRMDCDSGVHVYDISEHRIGAGDDDYYGAPLPPPELRLRFYEEDVMKSNQLCFLFRPVDKNGRVALQFTHYDMGPNDYVRVLAIGRQAEVVPALQQKTFRGLRRVSAETVDFKQVFVGNADETLVAYVVTEGSGLIQSFQTKVSAVGAPTKKPTGRPTTKAPVRRPTKKPTKAPTIKPSKRPTPTPTRKPTKPATLKPTKKPTKAPTRRPTKAPTIRRATG